MKGNALIFEGLSEHIQGSWRMMSRSENPHVFETFLEAEEFAGPWYLTPQQSGG